MPEPVPRLASIEDFRAFYGRDPDPDWTCWTGQIVEHSGRLVGFGSVVWDEYGRAWVFVDRRGDVNPLFVHRATLRAISALKEAGEDVLYALCDRSYPTAERWLSRLGFRPEPALSTEDAPVWSLDLKV